MIPRVAMLWQAGGGTDLGDLPWTPGVIAWTLLVLLVLALAAGAFFIGKLWGNWRANRGFAEDRDRMFSIEKSLQEFFESDRKRLEDEARELRTKVELLEKKSDEYKKKAAGVGMMGMGKDRKSDLLLQLMVENEALEEKLFEQNVKLKQERDEHLQRELQHVSVKRVMLSEILKDDAVRDSIRTVLADEGRLKRIPLAVLPDSPEQVVEGRARVVDDAGADPKADVDGGVDSESDAEASAPAGQAPSA